MKIPKSFELLGTTIKVVLVDKDEFKRTYGQWSPDEMTIRIRRDISPDLSAHTLLHEVLHAALDLANYDEHGKDEQFVDIISGLLAQFHKTAKY